MKIKKYKELQTSKSPTYTIVPKSRKDRDKEKGDDLGPKEDKLSLERLKPVLTTKEGTLDSFFDIKYKKK